MLLVNTIPKLPGFPAFHTTAHLESDRLSCYYVSICWFHQIAAANCLLENTIHFRGTKRVCIENGKSITRHLMPSSV